MEDNRVEFMWGRLKSILTHDPFIDETDTKNIAVEHENANKATIITPIGKIVVFISEEQVDTYNMTLKSIVKKICNEFSEESCVVNLIRTECLEIDLKRREEEIQPSVFAQILNECIELHEKKGRDYGNAFEDALNDEGLGAYRTMLSIRRSRFNNLSRNNKTPVFESLQETLKDFINYSAMTLEWMRKREQK